LRVAPESRTQSRNQSRNPIQRLLEIEEKGRGLALFGWAGVTVFAFLAAFASWQFAPGRPVHVARADDTLAGDITGGIRPNARNATGHVPTVPTPLPDGGISRADIDQLRSDLKDLRRVVGRIDMSQDVLARRIANLEDSVGDAHTAAQKPLQPLTPIAPPQPMANNSPSPASNPALAAVASASAPQVSAPAAPPLPATVTPQPVPRQPVTMPPKPASALPPAEKSTADHQAVDRTTLERMLLERGQSGLDGDGGEGNSLIPPLPDPVSIIPKSHPALALPPQPLPVPPGTQAQPLAHAPTQPQNQSQTQSQIQPMPTQPDPTTTGSVPAKPVLPIDPTKAVIVKSPAAPTQMTADEQKAASEKMALAMKDDQSPQAAPPAKSSETYGFDLGGYKSIGQVKKVWSDIEMRQGKLTKVLTPLAKLGEATDGVEIRLIAGPFTDKEQALRTCHQLRGATAKCEAIAYAGESILTKPAPETEHKPSIEVVKEPQAPEKPQVKRSPLKFEASKPLDLSTPTQ